ncbi:MAG: hypothetical protein O7H39_18310 [Gammaproteobacteria bacterium]|nr:hypothetical protein [Gammaproteobacteria bacterium]
MKYALTAVTRTVLVMSAVALVGCTSGASVVVTTSVPTPLVEPIPVNMGVHYDTALTTYVHEEDLDYFGKYRIEIGASQIPVFNQVFAAMFDSVTRVDSITGHGHDVDAVLKPTLEQLQFSIPQQTRSDFYEVWISYTIELYDPTGELIVAVPLKAYGKSNSKNFGFMEKVKEPALNEATIWALRDAAASLSFYFRHVPEIATWLKQEPGS